MIKNIVFDLGNVLLNFDPDLIISDFVSDEKLHNKISENIFKSKEWILLDRGEISTTEATQRFINRMPKNEKLIREIMKNWSHYLNPINDNVELLNKLAYKSIDLYVLSNFQKEAFEEVYDKYEFFEQFKGMIISYKEKTVKPEKEIYERLINRYNISPEFTLFIDDSIKNIEAAQKLGFKTIHFDNSINLDELVSNYIKEI